MDRKTIGQILTAGSVVVSLLFVGYELRQNTAVSRMQAYNNFVTALAEHTSLIATDPIITPLLDRVNGGAMPEEFSSEEQFRVTLSYAALLRIWEGLYVSVEEGILPDQTLELVGQGGAFNSPYFRSMWPTRMRPLLTVEFVRFFETLAWNRPD